MPRSAIRSPVVAMSAEDGAGHIRGSRIARYAGEIKDRIVVTVPMAAVTAHPHAPRQAPQQDGRAKSDSPQPSESGTVGFGGHDQTFRGHSRERCDGILIRTDPAEFGDRRTLDPCRRLLAPRTPKAAEQDERDRSESTGPPQRATR